MHIYKGGKEGAPNKVKGKDSRDRHKQGHEEAEAEKGHGRGQQERPAGKNGGGQDSRLRPHVSTRERAGQQAEASCQHEGDVKNWKNLRKVSQHSGVTRQRTRGEGIGSRWREMCGGRERRAAGEASRTSGVHPCRRRREKSGKEKQGRIGREERGEEGDEGDARCKGDAEKRGKKKEEKKRETTRP